MSVEKSSLLKVIRNIEMIMDSVTDGFFMLDKQFNFTYVNKAFEQICNLKKEDCIGINYWKQFPKATSLKFYVEYNRALSENVSVHFEEYATSLDKWVQGAVYPNPDGLFVYFTDITEQHKQSLVILSQNKKLREIAWMLSHKVRKPVASILGLAQLINRDNLLHPGNVEVIQGVIDAMADLDSIIRDIDSRTTEISIEPPPNE